MTDGIQRGNFSYIFRFLYVSRYNVRIVYHCGRRVGRIRPGEPNEIDKIKRFDGCNTSYNVRKAKSFYDFENFETIILHRRRCSCESPRGAFRPFSD